MRTLLRIRPFFLVAIALLAVVLFVSPRESRVFADGDAPPAPPEAGMDGAPAGMDGEEPKGDGDEEDSDTPVTTQEKVKKATERGVKWLKQAQLPNGSWGDITGDALYGGGQGKGYGHPAGTAALALFTLLKCKEPLNDSVVAKGFKFLRDKHKKPAGAYETSMALLAVTATADPFKKVKASADQGDRVKFPTGDWQQWAQSLHDSLLAKRTKAKTTGWRYMLEGNAGTEPGGNEDMSSTQLAALALFAAERCGIKTDSKVWVDIMKFSMKQQSDDGPDWDRAVYDKKAKSAPAPGAAPGGDSDKGRYAPPAGEKGVKDRCRGFAYIKSEKLPPDQGGPTGSMTGCAISNLMMARYLLAKRDDKLWANYDQKLVQQSIYDGCAWLDSNWLAFGNPQSPHYVIYHMYCCERAFDLIGNNLVGKHSWYTEFASELVARQHEKGYWKTGTTLRPEEVLDTCFALLVLKRSTKGGIPYGSITGGGDEPPEDNRGK